jgi:hypothetical protein
MSAVRRLVNELARVAVVAAMLASALASDDAPPPSASPLTNEDVVRMVVSGLPESAILESIRNRPEAFDLSDDMTAELRLAGVSSAIVAAMAARHAASAPSTPPTGRPKRDAVHLVVAINARGSGPRTIKVPGWADEDVKARFHLPKENDQREVKDLAVFLGCTSQEHIPDLWRSKTPLGRDMVSAVRHEMLAFVAGDTPAGKQPRLTLPARVEADVDVSESHDLVLGVAARIGDRWIQLASGTLTKVKIAAGSKPLTGLIERGGQAFEFKIELTAPRPAL